MGLNPDAPIELRIGEVCARKFGAGYISAAQVSLSLIGIRQIGILQVSSAGVYSPLAPRARASRVPLVQEVSFSLWEPQRGSHSEKWKKHGCVS